MKITDPKTYWEMADFENSYQMGSQPHREYLLHLLKDKGVKSLFDVGCGTGPIYGMITDDPKWDNIHKYKGTDYSRTMIETCKREFPYGDWEVQDARHLDEGSNTWDCVLLLHSLDHVNDYKAVIKEAARVSRKYVCIVLWRGFVGEGTNMNTSVRYGRQDGEPDWEEPNYLQEYSREALDEAYKEAGLKIVHEADGDKINGDYSHYNYLVLLEKGDE